MIYLEGDFEDVLRRGDFDVYVHGCNNIGGFGSGIAGIIARVFPQVRNEYLRWIQKEEPNYLGRIQSIETSSGIVVNAITQNGYGYDGAKYVSYDAVADCFKAIREQYQDRRICFPKIGAGLGGGDWGIISAIIDKELAGMDYTCIVRKEDVADMEFKFI